MGPDSYYANGDPSSSSMPDAAAPKESATEKKRKEVKTQVEASQKTKMMSNSGNISKCSLSG